ncbi:MAG TPA: phage tail tape measure protein [Thermoanaerobacterium sp.]|nr:phage tail tape measure protein [Thermoanaerobacterium sp.]
MAKVIDAILTLRDNFSATLNNATKSLENTAKQMQRTGKSIQSTGKSISKVGDMLTKSLTVPIIGAGGALLKLASDFDDAYDKIRIGTGATGDALKQLQSDFNAVYKNVPASMDEVSTTISDFNTRLGLTGEPLRKLSEQTILLSKMTKSDLQTTIEDVSHSFAAFGINAKDYSSSLDFVFKVSQSTGIGVEDLLQQLQSSAPVLQNMGLSFQNAAALIGQMSKAGVNTEQVMTGLNRGIANMAKKGVQDANKALAMLFSQIQKAPNSMAATQIAINNFGAKTGVAIAKAIREGKLNITDFVNTLNKSHETINKAAEDTEDFPEKIQKLKNSIAVGLQPAAMKIFDTINKLVPTFQRIADTVSKVGDMFAKLTPKQQDMILKFALMAAAIGPAVKMLGTMTKTIGNIPVRIGEIGKRIKMAGGLMKLILSPANLVVLAIVAIAVAAFLIIKYWQPISAFFKRLWSGIVQTLGLSSNTIKTFVAIFKTVGSIVKMQISIVIAIIKFLYPVVATVFSLTIGIIWQGIKLIVKLIGVFINAWASIAGFLSPIFKGIWNVIKWLVNGIIDFINVLIRALNKLHWKIPSWVPVMGGKEFGFSIPEIPKLAKGTNYFKGGTALVGEEGPELVELPRGSKVIPTKKTEQIINQGNNKTQNVTITIPKLADNIVIREDADIDKIAKAIVYNLQKTSLNYGGA